MMKYIDIPWASMGYFDEHSRVDLLVHTADNSFTIYNITTDVSLGEDWLTCEVGNNHPRRGIYIPAKDVVYIELIPNVPMPPDPLWDDAE
jgi:hypothetical protein